MDEFVVFLIIGLLMITAMVVVFTGNLGIVGLQGGNTYGGNWRYSNGGGNYYYNTRTSTTTTVQVINPNDTLIGPENAETWRTIGPVSINASFMASNSGYTAQENYLFNGLLFGSNGIDISADVNTNDLLGGYIRFDVDRANGYGGLVIKVNGVVLSDKKLVPGTYSFLIDKSLVNVNNKIEIYPASSLWRIWAPNLYYIKNLDFVLQSQYSKPSEIKFNIYQEEFDRLTKTPSRVMLDLQDHKGVLKININGNEIYSNQSSGYQPVYFDQKKLKSGENVLDFYALENSQFQGMASLMFYYQTTRENSASYTFEISKNRYKYLNTSYGAIRFNVTNIQKQGGVAISVTNSSGNTTAYFYDMLRNQTYVFFFNATQVSLGTNTVTLRSIDNATFYMKNLRVEV